MTDYYARIREATADAETRGWERVSGSYSPTWRRSVEHPTPADVIEYGWWPGETYKSIQFVTFVLYGRERAPKVVYRTSRTYWTPCSDRSISCKRALEILAADLDDIHRNHWKCTCPNCH